MLECPLYNSINDKVPSLSQCVVLFFSQLEHQVDVSFYLMQITALSYSKELAGFTPS